MDTFTDPTIETVTWMKSAQVGATEVINNLIGFHIDQDPAPMLAIQPTLELAQAWSKDRFSPMVRDTSKLKGKVKEVKSRNVNNTLLNKRFPGGHLTVAGANSPASLASRPVRIVLFDEVDRYPASAGTEGDPINLGKKRAVTFYNRRYVEVSTPTIDGASRIQKSYEASDQRQYWVPCPHCGKEHLLEWKNITWEKDDEGNHLPETAAHACPHCGALEFDSDLPGMLAKGRWIKEHPEIKGHAGFHINELYSPWVRFQDTVKNFLESHHDPEMYKTWVNTALGEVWKDAKGISSSDILMKRRENYTAELVPWGGVVITVGVDVQDDRLEWETTAWGLWRESWSLEHLVIPGDPNTQGPWDALDTYLRKTFTHETGARLRILATGIDTGGHCTKAVYDYCSRRTALNVFALKGEGGQGKPLTQMSKRKIDAYNLRLYRVGVDTAKDIIAASLGKTVHGGGYCHFPAGYGKDYFEQLIAERPVTRFVKGQRTRTWQLKRAGDRNEALDMRVYSLAALTILGIDLNETVKQFHERMQGQTAAKEQRMAPRRRMVSKVA